VTSPQLSLKKNSALKQVLPVPFSALESIFLFRVTKLWIVPLGLGSIIALFRSVLLYSTVTLRR